MRVAMVVSVLALLVSSAQALAAKPGKVYIVGMGLGPDLVTLRGVEAIKKADLFILESASDQQVWGKYVGKKPVIFVSHMARIFYGTDPATITDPAKKAIFEKNDRIRKDLVAKVEMAVAAGKTVAYLQWGDPMVFGNLYLLEMLPTTIASEIVPGIGVFQAGSAALKRSTVFGWDTNGVILTMGDWPGRADTNDKLMAPQTSMVFYTMGLKYPELFAQLGKAYPPETPVAVVMYAGDPKRETVRRSTVGAFLKEVDWAKLPPEMHTLFVGKFLNVGQARKDGVFHGKDHIEANHGKDVPSPEKACETH
jgi:precorrin-4/cobalt-precorrin-4 C11-methyltransferase